jgi:hypothetical protein
MIWIKVVPTTLGILLSKIIERKHMDFTHAVLDDGDIIRKYRWSKREAKWYKDSHPDLDVVELPKEEVKPFNTNDYEEAPY